MGLRRRRHFLTDGRRVVDLEDELFAQGDGTGRGRSARAGWAERAAGGSRASSHRADARHRRHGPGRARRDHPCSPDRRSGCPRWAWDRQDRGGAPPCGLSPVHVPLPARGTRGARGRRNPTFLRYIDQVLPSLGETGVELSTATGLYKTRRAAGGRRARRGGAPQGRPPHGSVHQASRPPAGTASAKDRRDPLRQGRAHLDSRGFCRDRDRRPAPVWHAQRAPPCRRDAPLGASCRSVGTARRGRTRPVRVAT